MSPKRLKGSKMLTNDGKKIKKIIIKRPSKNSTIDIK